MHRPSREVMPAPARETAETGQSRLHGLAIGRSALALSLCTFAFIASPEPIGSTSAESRDDRQPSPEASATSKPTPLPDRTLEDLIDQNIAGMEAVSADGYYLFLLDDDDIIRKVYEQAEDSKTIFVSVQFVGESAVSACAFVSRWDIQNKPGYKLLPPKQGDDCTQEDMKKLSRRKTFGRKFNGRRFVDGTFGTPVTRPARCDATFYRYYGRPRHIPKSTGYSGKMVFEDPVKLHDGKLAEVGESVHYRYTSKDGKAAAVRIDKTDIEELTPMERKHLYKWGYVDRDCLPARFKMDGPLRHAHTVRGKRPNKKRDANRSR